MTHLEVYEDRNRSRNLVLGSAAGVLAAGLLLLLPQLQGALGVRNVTPLRIFVLILAGALGVLAIRLAIAAAFTGLEKRQAVVAWRNLLSWALYVLLLVMLATAAGINLSALLLAGGVLSVIAAIASQNTLNNFFAGLVLLLVRPYRIGDSVYLRSGSFGGAQYEGLIVDVGSLYTTLSSNGELFRIPNSVVIGSVLVPDYKPLRADVALQLPSGLSLVQLEEKIRSRLSLRPGARLFLVADQYAVQEGHAQVTVRLQIKADEWLSAEHVMSAIDASLSELSSGDSKPRLMDASDGGST
ncbi:MAG: mechanosensitive ion channel family protein [Candidatus Dormibacteraeota bacterium]|nr:mechanosensitive ion channel family protein [Candidatus Dormibacteraeota bacterium]